jgi:DNA-directed RNA polymerase specialized sigma24 family protein
MAESPADLTGLLIDWRKGNQEAGNELIQAVYERLHRMASYYLRGEHAGHTLEATALVHELYVKMLSSKPVKNASSRLEDRAGLADVPVKRW